MTDLAMNSGDAPVSLQSIAKRQDISRKYLERIMRELSAAGLVSGSRGKGGGYRLSGKPDLITVGTIVKTVDGDPVQIDCLKSRKHCRREASCATRDLWLDISEKIDSLLQRYSLSDLIELQKEKDRQINVSEVHITEQGDVS